MDAAQGGSHALAYPGESLEIAVGVKGHADLGTDLFLTFGGLDGAVLDQLRVPVAAGRRRLTAPDRPSTIDVSLGLKGAGRIAKLWLRIDPVIPPTGETSREALLTFDLDHYRGQLGVPVDDPLTHYLTEG